MKQPEALRLADELDGAVKTGYWEAAAELRRLVSFNQQLMDEVARLSKELAAQRTWVGLTDEEKRQLFDREDYQGWLDYINAIEAKLMEKNT